MSLPQCPSGAACPWVTDDAHADEYSHPCPHGRTCSLLIDPSHLRRFSHGGGKGAAPPTPPAPAAHTPRVAHRGVRCDRCHVSPIRGYRYKYACAFAPCGATRCDCVFCVAGAFSARTLICAASVRSCATSTRLSIPWLASLSTPCVAWSSNRKPPSPTMFPAICATCHGSLVCATCARWTARICARRASTSACLCVYVA